MAKATHATALAYRPAIDGLRAIAVLSVIVFHAWPSLLPAGFAGVDVFFVISGFLITQILVADFCKPGATAGEVIGRFYVRRVRRLFPALVVVLVGCLAWGYSRLLPAELEKLSSSTLASAGFCLNLVLARHTGYFEAEAHSQPLLHLWSLGVEEQFYFLWPLVIWLVVRARARLVPVAVFLATCSYVWNWQKPEPVYAAAFFLPHYRLWELMVGALAAVTIDRDERHRAPSGWLALNGLPVLGFGLVAGGLVALRSTAGMPTPWMIVPVAGTALLLRSDDRAWLNRRILGARALVAVGLISYPLYLWHWPLLVFTSLSFTGGDAPVMVGAAVAVSFGLAWLTYRWIETPVRAGRNSPSRTILLVAAMCLVAGGAGLIARARGFPSRYPPLIEALSGYAYSPVKDWRSGSYFLEVGDVGRGFPDDPAEIDPRKPSLVLWGDYHAAGLYPGLRALYGSRYNIVQRTVSGTPPFLQTGEPALLTAVSISTQVLDSIRRLRPAVVMIGANWVGYRWPQIELTIDRVKAAGVRRIIVVGPLPQWKGSLFQQVFNYVRTHPGAAVPTRMEAGSRPEPLAIDPQMAAMCRRLGVEYVSPCALLHNDQGYLFRDGDTPEAFFCWDYAHLSVEGSLYLVSHFPPLL